MAGKKNLKRFGKDKPPLTHDKAVEYGKKGAETRIKNLQERKNISECIKTILEEEQRVKKLNKKGRHETVTGSGAELVATALFNKALKGDVFAAKELMDRTEGKVVEKSEVKTVTKVVNLTDEGLDEARVFILDMLNEDGDKKSDKSGK